MTATEGGGMEHIYLLVEGEYSNYRAVAAFSDRALGEDFRGRLKKRFPEASYRLEAVLLNLPGNVYDDYQIYTVELREDGEGPVAITDDEEWHYDFERALLEDTEESLLRPGYLIIMVLARDEAHAIKIANERRVRYILEREGRI